ncbi:Transcription initiation protein SPT3 [Exophiala xenobiotica]|nr:Transcription initiation protein SPT3 [Exophiala xenobiotica]
MASQQHTLPDGRIICYDLSRAPKTTSTSEPVVLLSNSLAAPYRSWDQVVEVLLAEGYGVLRYDQPGHGKTSAPSNLDSTTFESMADDVLSLLQGLKISKLYAWIGVSMGAAKGIVFAARNPGMIGKLIVCDTISSSPKVAGTTDVFGPRTEVARKEGNMNSLVDATIGRWFSEDWRKSNPEELQNMRRIMMDTTVEGFVTCCRALQSSSFDLNPLASKIGDSVDGALLVVGELDANLPQEMNVLRSKIQEGFDASSKSIKVELKVIKQAGHVCYVDGFEQFCQTVIEYLKSSN